MHVVVAAHRGDLLENFRVRPTRLWFKTLRSNHHSHMAVHDVRDLGHAHEAAIESEDVDSTLVQEVIVYRFYQLTEIYDAEGGGAGVITQERLHTSSVTTQHQHTSLSTGLLQRLRHKPQDFISVSRFLCGLLASVLLLF